MRFTVKNLLFETALIASLIGTVKMGPSLAGIAMLLVFFGLILFAIRRPENNSPSAR